MDIINYSKIKKVENDLNQHKQEYSEQRQSDKLKVTSIEKELNDYKKILQEVNVNQEAKQSVTGYNIVSLPKNTANGQANAIIKGLTATNAVKNGSFNNGTTSWSTGGYQNEFVVIDGYAKTTASSYTNKGFIQYNVLKPNRKYYVRFKTKVDDYTKLSESRVIFGIAETDGFSDFSISSNNWETKSVIYNKTSEHNAIRFYYTFTEVSSISAYLDDVLVIDLTETFGAGNEPTKEQCDIIFSNWFDGTKSVVGDFRIKSVGKNLFDEERKFIEHGFVKNSEGYYLKQQNIAYKKIIWENKDLEYTGQLVVEIKAKSSGDINIGSFPLIIYTDGSYTNVNYTHNAGFNVRRVVSTAGKIVKQIEWTYGNGSSETTIEYLYVSKDINSTYEKYKESVQYVNSNTELKSLPNGTKDEISNGKLTQRTKKYTLQSSDVISIDTSMTNIDIALIKKPVDFIGYNIQTSTKSALLEGYSEIETITDETTMIGRFSLIHNATNIAVCVTKGTTLEQARTALTGKSLIYQLTNPLTLNIDISGALFSYPNGTVYVENSVADAGVYTDKITILNTNLPISSIERISKINYQTGVETELNPAQAVINANKLSFTHPSLTNGDIVFFTYYYSNELTTSRETTLSYYDSRYTIKDKVNNKFYKWDIEVNNGVPSIVVSEV